MTHGLTVETLDEAARSLEDSQIEIKQLYKLGVRGFWFTDAQFIPSRGHIQNAKEILQAILDEGLNDISAVYFNKGLVYERLNNVNLAVDYYKRAIDLKPQYYEYFEKRARMQRSGEWVNNY